jgi:hypothetical protein
MSENREKYGDYSETQKPGELLGLALKHLESATAENFREKIEAAASCIHGAKDWLESTVLICGERPEKLEQGRNQQNGKAV